MIEMLVYQLSSTDSVVMNDFRPSSTNKLRYDFIRRRYFRVTRDVLEGIHRLIICAMGAIYLNNRESLYIYLKTLHAHCRWSAFYFTRKMTEARTITRNLRHTWLDLMLIARCADVHPRVEARLISHLSGFSHHTELLLDAETRGEAFYLFAIIIEYVILTWKYVDYCLPFDVVHDDSIVRLNNITEENLEQFYEYRFMCGRLNET
jgi:hypothetical protein